MKAVILVTAGVFFTAHATEHDPEEINREINNISITCSSSVRLQADATKYFLNSMGINFGYGSG